MLVEKSECNVLGEKSVTYNCAIVKAFSVCFAHIFARMRKYYSRIIMGGLLDMFCGDKIYLYILSPQKNLSNTILRRQPHRKRTDGGRFW
jgi:hypothetical protein